MKQRVRMLAVAAVAATATVLAGLPAPAAAQLDNRPYQFRGDGSGGMSNAGRQTILRQKLYDETPSNLVRGPGDRLLQVDKGPGGTPVVSEQGGEVIPGYRGRSAFRRDAGMEVGVFNAFFRSVPGNRDAGLFFSGGAATRLSITGWTLLVSDGTAGVAPTNGYSSVESWTTQVFLHFGN